MKHADEMRAQGFIVDDTCYPWFAYKGYRFAHTEHHLCYTALESKLLRQVTAVKRFMLFTYDEFYPCGGMGDFQGSYDTIQEAYDARGGADFHTIFDTQTGECVQHQ